MRPRLTARARHYANRHGFASATIELPGSGGRPPLADLEQARMDLRRAMAAGEPVDEIVDALVLPLVELAVPEWQATVDAVLELPEIGGPVGYEGGFISVGIALALAEPRISAALLFAGSIVPRVLLERARRITIPLQVLLQRDDEGNDRQQALDLFDAFGSRERTLHANLGGHARVPSFEIGAGGEFFDRHLIQRPSRNVRERHVWSPSPGGACGPARSRIRSRVHNPGKRAERNVEQPARFVDFGGRQTERYCELFDGPPRLVELRQTCLTRSGPSSTSASHGQVRPARLVAVDLIASRFSGRVDVDGEFAFTPVSGCGDLFRIDEPHKIAHAAALPVD